MEKIVRRVIYMKSKLLSIVGYCKNIKSDKRAKKLAAEMWKNYIEEEMNYCKPGIRLCMLHGLQCSIGYYEVRTLERDDFFAYMRYLIERSEAL